MELIHKIDTNLILLAVAIAFIIFISKKVDFRRKNVKICLTYLYMQMFGLAVQIFIAFGSNHLDYDKSTKIIRGLYTLMYMVDFSSVCVLLKIFLIDLAGRVEYNLKEKIVLYTPTIIVGVALIVNTFIPIIFKIDASGDIVITKLYYVMISIKLIYFGFAINLVKNNLKGRTSADNYFGSILNFFNIVMFIYEFFIPEFILIFNIECMLAMTFLAISKDKKSEKDYFTKMYQDSELCNYIVDNKIDKCTVILVDIYNLDKINQLKGRREGDKVVKTISGLINTIFKNQIRFRDEDAFIILAPELTKEELDEKFLILDNNIKNENITNDFNNVIDYTIVYDEYDSQKYPTIIGLMKKLYYDLNMKQKRDRV